MNHHPLEAAAPSSPFTATELARLASYKAAVAAGFYTDALPVAPEPAELPALPFTARELGRLSAYRAAVQAGFYTDAEGR